MDATPYLDRLKRSLAAAQEEQACGDKPKVPVLLVEDNLDQMDAYREVLAGKGFGPIMEARSGEEAARHFLNHPGSLLVIVDGHLEGSLNGAELCRLFRESAARTGRFLRLVFITGEEGFRDDALTHGADAFLMKPVELPVLYKLLDRAADQIREHEATRRCLDEAREDLLTGLWSRRYFEELVERELSRVSRKGGRLSFLFVDLNGFKKVNDTHGHLAGDQLLCFVAELMRRCTRPYDLLGRMGGDEFVIVMSDDARGTASTRMRRRLQSAFRRRRFVCDTSITGQSVELSASAAIGRSMVRAKDIGDDLRKEARRLLKQADTAMYVAKRRSKRRKKGG